jgi:hypothetical protein
MTKITNKMDQLPKGANTPTPPTTPDGTSPEPLVRPKLVTRFEKDMQTPGRHTSNERS